MTDPTIYPDSKPQAARRWVRVVGIVAIVVILLIVVMVLIGGGDHTSPIQH